MHTGGFKERIQLPFIQGGDAVHGRERGAGHAQPGGSVQPSGRRRARVLVLDAPPPRKLPAELTRVTNPHNAHHDAVGVVDGHNSPSHGHNVPLVHGTTPRARLGPPQKRAQPRTAFRTKCHARIMPQKSAPT